VDRRNHPQGYIQQWNLGIEQQLPAKFSFVAAYVGSKATHISQYSQQIDQISDALLSQAAAQFAAGGRSAVSLLRPTPSPFLLQGRALALAGPVTTVGQLLRPFPEYNSVELAGQGSFDSVYHSFHLTAQKRLPAGGALSVAYTKAKLISDTDTLTGWLENTVGVIQDNNNLRAERSLSSQDVPQRLVVSYVLDLPIGTNHYFFPHMSGAMNRIFGDWGLDGVTSLQKGFPLVFSNGQVNDVTLFGAGSRPNLLSGCRKSAAVEGRDRLHGWFNINCFAAPPDFSFGTEPRVDSSLRAAGVNNLDLAAFKRVPLGHQDRASAELRIEFFNLFNRVQFAPPSTVCCTSNNADFGVVTSTDPGTNPRLVQFASRIYF
jgi:hypothetical protein